MSRRSATTMKVFVGSLPAGTTADELRELFQPYGAIAECDVVNRCGFLHLEDKNLAFKAIEELNNTTFKGTRISVEKGRVKPPNRGGGGRGGPRNGFGPMRGGRDNYRSGPYMRDGPDGRFDRGPRGGPPRGGFGGGFDRGYGRPGPRGPMGDYGPTGDRRPPYMEDRNGGYGGGYDSYGGGDSMYNGGYNNYDRGSNGRGAPYERKMGGQGGPGGPMGRGGMMGGKDGLGGGPGSFERRQPDMFSRRDAPKPMGGGGYGDPQSRNAPGGYDSGYPPMQNRGYGGGPGGPRRDMPPPPRRF